MKSTPESRKELKPGQAAAETKARLLSWSWPLLVALVTFAAFLPALQNGFVDWDDDKNLINNPFYRGLGWSELRWMFTTFHMGHYQPLSWMTLGFDYLLWGMNPFGYHLTNLLLHSLNAALFYFIALRLLRLSISSAAGEMALRPAAAFAALLFAVHPLRVESVAWATERRDVLSGLFFLASVLCYLGAAGLGKDERMRRRWLTGAVVIYGLSLLSKASGMTLPLALLALDVYPLRRLGGGKGKWLGRDARKVWREKIPFLMLALIFGIVALIAQREAAALVSFQAYGAAMRLAQALYGLAFYLWKTLVPVGLSPLYELSAHPTPWDWRLLLGAAVALAATALALLFRRRWPALLSSWACYVILLLPVLGAAQSGPQLVADRYSYLPCLGWALLAGAGALYGWRSGWRRSVIAGFSGVLILVAVLTWRQTEVWHDTERLWRYVFTVAPESGLAHKNLGNFLFQRGRLGEAAEQYRRALEINPEYVEAHNNLGVILAGAGKVEEAAEQYRRALQIDPEYAEAHNNLGDALVKLGRLEEAAQHFHRALEINPQYADAHYNLGNVLYMRGELDEGMEHYRQALRINPEFAEAHYNLGNILFLRGGLEEAMEHYRRALEINPQYANARYNLAKAHEALAEALAAEGKKEQALQHREEARRILNSRPEAPAPR